jgi:ABC-type Fe2+-enterobactin transport system substrate-binding protein
MSSVRGTGLIEEAEHGKYLEQLGWTEAEFAAGAQQQQSQQRQQEQQHQSRAKRR